MSTTLCTDVDMSAAVVCPITDEIIWAGNGLTDYGHEVYSCGDCWALAWHVAAESGGRLWLLGPLEEWCHVVVEVAPGLFLDHRGLSTATELDGRWEEPLRRLPSAATVSIEAYTDILYTGFCYGSGHAEAHAVAARLLARERHRIDAHQLVPA